MGKESGPRKDWKWSLYHTVSLISVLDDGILQSQGVWAKISDSVLRYQLSCFYAFSGYLLVLMINTKQKF